MVDTLEGPGIVRSQCPTCKQPAWKKHLKTNHKYLGLADAAAQLTALLQQQGAWCMLARAKSADHGRASGGSRHSVAVAEACLLLCCDTQGMRSIAAKSPLMKLNSRHHSCSSRRRLMNSRSWSSSRSILKGKRKKSSSSSSMSAVLISTQKAAGSTAHTLCQQQQEQQNRQTPKH